MLFTTPPPFSAPWRALRQSRGSSLGREQLRVSCFALGHLPQQGQIHPVTLQGDIPGAAGAMRREGKSPVLPLHCSHSFIRSFINVYHVFIFSTRLCQASTMCQGHTQIWPPSRPPPPSSGSFQPLGEKSSHSTHFNDRLKWGVFPLCFMCWGAYVCSTAWLRVRGRPVSGQPPQPGSRVESVETLPCAHPVPAAPWACLGEASGPQLHL